jgi:predicted transcriptional regulator
LAPEIQRISPDRIMNAADIIEVFGRGIPATLDSAMIVDVCAYLRSTKSPVALVLSGRGETRGVLSHRDIVHASGRLGSSVMQMTAGELVREQAPVCQKSTSMIEVLELLTETSNDFVLVCDGSTVHGVITLQDIAELLMQALGGEETPATEQVQAETQATQTPKLPEIQTNQHAVHGVSQLAAADSGFDQGGFNPVSLTPAPAESQSAVTAPAAAHAAQQAQPQPLPAIQQVPVYAAAPEVPSVTAFAPVPLPSAQQAAEQPQQAVPVQHEWASFNT